MRPQRQMEIFLSGKQSLKFVTTQPSHKSYMGLTDGCIGTEKFTNQECEKKDNQTSAAVCMS
jgi:hypothetical protein